MTTAMLEDKRPVEAVYFNDEEGGHYKVGTFGCTKIEVYGDGGLYRPLPWVAVYKRGVIIARIPAHMVQINYMEESKEE